MPTLPDRRRKERRELPDRRTGEDRRVDPTGKPPGAERRSGEDRRKGDRRGADRRLEQQSGSDQVRAALQVLTTLAEGGTLDDEPRRLLDTAMLRLRFALDQLEPDA